MKLVVDHLSFSYHVDTPVLRDISFEISSGDVVCILGPNGSGKTTLLDCIMGLHRPNAGDARLDGASIRDMEARQIAQAVGYVPQAIVPSFDYTVIDYVVTGCAPHLKMFKRPGKEEYARADEAIERMGIGHIRDKSYARISGGERQQVSIARVLAQKPDIILLDEPTSHLDYGNQIKVLKTAQDMAATGFGVLMTTHNPDHALMLGGNVAVIGRDGNFVFGQAETIVTEEFLRQLYGTELYLAEVASAGRCACVAPKL